MPEVVAVDRSSVPSREAGAEALSVSDPAAEVVVVGVVVVVVVSSPPPQAVKPSASIKTDAARIGIFFMIRLRGVVGNWYEFSL